MRIAIIALMILPALANRIASPLAGRQNVADNENIVAEKEIEELQEDLSMAKETDYISQRQEGEQTAVLPAEAFGLKQEELEKLYKVWLATVPSDGDSSVSAFLQWMKENDAKGEQLGPAQQSAFGRWARRIGRWIKKVTSRKRREFDDDDIIESEREMQEEFPIAEDYINQRQEKEQTAVLPEIAFGLNREELEKLYRIWMETLPPGRDSSVTAFLEWMEENKKSKDQLGPGQQSIAKWWKKLWDQILKKKTRRTVNDETVEAEKEEFPIAENSRSQRQENEQSADSPSKAEKTEADRKSSEAFDCEKNSPCTADNIAKERFYFASKDPKRFIQCDAFGACYAMSCKYGTIWDDKDKTCTYQN